MRYLIKIEQFTPGIDKAITALKEIPVWKKALGNIALRSVLMNFRAGGRPSKWVSLKGATVLMRRKFTSTPLRDTGRLMAGIHIEDPGGNLIAVSTSADSKDYAAIHQFGGTTKPTITDKMRRYFWFRWADISGALNAVKGGPMPSAAVFKNMALMKDSKLGTKLEIKIPARPYMVLQPEDVDEINEYIRSKLVAPQ